MKFKDYRLALIVSIIVIALFSWYYLFHRGFPLNMGFTNAIVAFSATVVLTISFAIGPLSRFIPFCKKYLDDRKYFGLIGYGLASLHLLLVIFVMLEENRELFFSDIASIGFAVLAFAIFTIMAVTSTKGWIDKLGYENWKSLQRSGYIAIIGVLAHIALLEQGIFLTREVGQIAIVFILLVVLLRIIALVLNIPARKKIKV